MFLIKFWTDELAVDERESSRRMADKCGEAVRLSVENAIGIQIRPPFSHSTLNSTFCRFGKLEKSNDCPEALQPSMLGGDVSRVLDQTGPGEGVGSTVGGGYER